MKDECVFNQEGHCIYNAMFPQILEKCEFNIDGVCTAKEDDLIDVEFEF